MEPWNDGPWPPLRLLMLALATPPAPRPPLLPSRRAPPPALRPKVMLQRRKSRRLDMSRKKAVMILKMLAELRKSLLMRIK